MTVPAENRYPFDTAPLTEPVDMRAVAEFTRAMRRQHPTPASAVVIWVVAGAIGAAVVLPMIGLGFAGLAAALAGGNEVSLVFGLPALVPLLIIAIGVPLTVLGVRRSRVKAYRIARFAQANGMSYRHRLANPPLPGMIFQNGDSRMASSLVRGQHPRFVEFGNYRYTTGSGKNRSTHHWGYVAVKLDVPLPNIVLDALGNNALGTNLPASFSRDQRLSLEGDFDRFFTLYCPRGYEADALYLFTPDIMARFIDHAAQLDVEIVDDWMFLYMQRPASTTDAATWAWLFSTVGALMGKFDQWARWRDDRLREAQAVAPPHPLGITPAPDATASASGVTASSLAATPPALPFAPPAGMLAPPPGVAREGRRLKKRVNWVLLVVIGVVVLMSVVPQFFSLLGLLFFR
ncbi:hypothetical protein [Microbacterium sp. USHLN186]|uniref:hypothetical protein n=1 Tax=Microbacterium sp. USHLN186 TaxID=3081286 RepID=UPI00301AC245